VSAIERLIDIADGLKIFQIQKNGMLIADARAELAELLEWKVKRLSEWNELDRFMYHKLEAQLAERDAELLRSRAEIVDWKEKLIQANGDLLRLCMKIEEASRLANERFAERNGLNKTGEADGEKH